MKHIVYTLLFQFIVLSSHANSDPFTKVEQLTLGNGLQVYLAPSKQSKLISVRLEVGVGYIVENSNNNGVSHLLEHVLFRDRDLNEEMTFLQVITEAGGKANGTTEKRKTSYFATIPAEKGPWLLDIFEKMLLEPKITEEYVRKEKSTVELEIGRPGPVDELLQFDITKILFPSYLRTPEFWESEFGIPKHENFSNTETQLSNRRLTLEQVKAHYADYYYPANMILYIAGNFDREKTLSAIRQNWGKIPNSEGKRLPPDVEPTLRESPYRDLKTTNSNPNIFLGAKLWQIKMEEEPILESYLQYVAHRLMKKIRNLKGQAYTASARTTVFRGYGYSGVNFETSSNNFEENLQIAQNYLEKETSEEALTDQMIEEAKKLYLNQYALRGVEAEDLMDLAIHVEKTKKNYGKFSSPYAALLSIDSTSYRQIIKKSFIPVRAYSIVERPPLFFRYDAMILSCLVIIGTFFFLRSVLTKNFQHDKVRWIRKVEYPPLKLVEFIAFVFACYGVVHSYYLIDRVVNYTGLAHFQILEYVSDFALISIGLATAQIFFSFVPKKLMIMDDKLVVKSLSYFSTHIPLNQISNVEAVRITSLKLKDLFAVKHRFHFYSFKFLKKGILINLESGKSHFFSISNPDNAAIELQNFLLTPDEGFIKKAS